MPCQIYAPGLRARLLNDLSPAVRALLLSAFWLVTPFPAGASDDQNAPVLRPGPLVSRVLEAHPRVAARNASLAAARAGVEPAAALPDPRLTVSTAPRTFDGFTTPSGERRGISGIVEISQSLPWPGTLSLRERLAEHQVDVAASDVETVRLELAAAAREHYAQWVYVHNALTVNANSLELIGELRRVSETRYANGIASLQDVLQAEVEQQRLKRQRLQLNRRRTVLQARINALLDQPASTLLGRPAGLPEPVDLPPVSLLEARALATHPLLDGQAGRVAVQGEREALAKKDFYPQLSAFARNNDFRPASETRAEVGISIDLPLNRSRRRAALDAARAERMRSQFEAEDIRLLVLTDLARAVAELREASASLTLYDSDFLPRTEENLGAARSAYGAGGGDFSDVITAEQLRLDARLQRERARADYYIALARVNQWTGGAFTALQAALDMNHE